jgi:glycosyltransferase involved in cell wall biosynthesis
VRILHVIARLNVGGAALSVLELAAGQRRAGHEVTVVAGAIPAGEASLEYLADEMSVPYLHVPALRREVSPRDDLRAVRALRQVLRRERPDVLHTHTSKAGTTGRLASRLVTPRPRAIVHTFHGHVLSGYFEPSRERAYRVIERGLAKLTGRIIAVSEQVRDDLVTFGIAPPGKIVVVHYGFDLDARLGASTDRDEHRATTGATPDDFVIGWSGRLSDIKQPLDLVRTLAKVDGARLVIAGDGELRDDVELLAAELGVTDRLTILGYVADIGAWYRAFDMFLMTSRNEGAPVVAIEASAAGLPVVATDAGGTRTVVDHEETGFVAAVGDTDALAAYARRLRDDVELRGRLGAEGARRMRERFSTERMVRDTDAVYRRLLA